MTRPRGRPRKVPKPPCVHHWMIDFREVGACKLCGAVKDFAALPQYCQGVYVPAGERQTK